MIGKENTILWEIKAKYTVLAYADARISEDERSNQPFLLASAADNSRTDKNLLYVHLVGGILVYLHEYGCIALPVSRTYTSPISVFFIGIYQLFFLFRSHDL